MKFIIGSRGSGVTTDLLYEACRFGGVLIVPTFTSKECAKDLIDRLGLAHIDIFTVNEIINGGFRGYKNAKIFVSDVEFVLNFLLVHLGVDHSCSIESMSASLGGSMCSI